MQAAELSQGATAYYVFCLSTITLLAGLIVSVRQFMWLSYAGQALAFLTYFAALDGQLREFLGLTAYSDPVISGIAGGIACAAGFAVCGLLIRREHLLRRLTPLLLCLALLSLLAPLGLFVLEPSTFHRSLSALFWLMISAQILPPVTWFFLSSWARLVVMPLTVAIILLIAVIGVASETGGPLMPGSSSGLRRGIMIWITLSGAVCMLAMTGMIQRTRIRNAERALDATRRELEALQSAQQAERNMDRAREIANLRGEQLASAAHDIRQPLIALRASARQLNSAQDEPPHELIDAIDYVESLAENYLHIATRNEEIGLKTSAEKLAIKATDAEKTGAINEEVDAQLFLSSIETMFAVDARNAGIELRTVASSLKLQAAPLALMRIASNCVTNAINHSHCTVLLVGWRRRVDTAELWFADNGDGLPNSFLEKATELNTKRRTSSGHGLGLAIIKGVAADNGWRIELGPLSKPSEEALRDKETRGGTLLKVCEVALAHPSTSAEA